MAGFFEKLFGVSPEEAAVEVWDCDPLVVVDDDNVVAFAGRTKVEFTPEKGDQRASALSLTAVEGWQPSLVVDSKEVVDILIPLLGRRGGIVLRGKDTEGFVFTWYVNGSADLYLTALREDEEVEPEPEAEGNDGSEVPQI